MTVKSIGCVARRPGRPQGLPGRRWGPAGRRRAPGGGGRGAGPQSRRRQPPPPPLPAAAPSRPTSSESPGACMAGSHVRVTSLREVGAGAALGAGPWRSPGGAARGRAAASSSAGRAELRAAGGGTPAGASELRALAARQAPGWVRPPAVAQHAAVERAALGGAAQRRLADAAGVCHRAVQAGGAAQQLRVLLAGPVAVEATAKVQARPYLLADEVRRGQRPHRTHELRVAVGAPAQGRCCRCCNCHKRGSMRELSRAECSTHSIAW
jgi:hypothetical protein